ncbi:blastula protease 10-like, partial [Saccostrea cucullata]|uniref:blastula protease 10-like n=1 Tax=Saccostrea cuccullata TaxID=36930 RepID=UPI002ED4BAE4
MWRAWGIFFMLMAVTYFGHTGGRSQHKASRTRLVEDIRRFLELVENEANRVEDQRENESDNQTYNENQIRNENEIDSMNIDPDDPNEQLLSSFGVVVNGKVLHSKGLHPEDSKKFKEEKLEKTIERKEETDKEGEPGKEKRRRKRNFGPSWPNWPKAIVPYIIDNNLIANRGYFLEAVELFNKLTCIRWKPSSPEVATEVGHTGYVRVKNGSSCGSGVGFGGNGEHVLSLAEPGCGSVGIAVHEMLHRLGQRHEHVRSDRDRYVRIVWKNMKPDSKYHYYKRLTYNRNPYDIGSIMHTNFGSSVELRDKNLKFLHAPNGQILSYYDLKDVVDQYECTAHCTSPPVCENGGYVNVTCKCTCPAGFTGITCQTVVTDT